MKNVLFLILSLVIFVGCKTDDEPIVEKWTSIATVENPSKNSVFYFRLDNNDRMKVQTTAFPYYIPKDGQRIIALYSILSVNNQNALYNHQVGLYDYYEVLTKGIFNVKPSQQDSIGNDPIAINSIWIGSDYLNVDFAYYGNNQIHFINLVSDTSKTYTDGKIHLEFRHNANDDAALYTRSGVSSFKLHDLKAGSTVDSINLVIHTKEFVSPSDKTYNLTYKFGSLASQQKVPKVQLSKELTRVK